MKTADETRHALNHGHYLVHNAYVRHVLTAVDSLLNAAAPPSRAKLSIDPKRILICNYAHIGDVILATSVIPVLRARFPRAELGFLVHPTSAIALNHNPHVSQVHHVEHWHLNRSGAPLRQKVERHATSAWRALHEVRDREYDLAVDLYPYLENSAVFLAAAGIPNRLGWTSGGLGALYTHAVDWSFGQVSVVDWFKRLLAQIDGCEPYLELAKPSLYEPPEAAQQWSALAKSAGVRSRYTLFHVGAGAAIRRWPDESWLELARLCVEAGEQVVMIGLGREDSALCGLVARAVPGVIDLAGKLSWGQMIAAIRAASAIVGLDSSSMHVAGTVRLPTVCVAAGIVPSSMWHPKRARLSVIVTPTPCSPCYLPDGCSGMECIRRTSARTVFAALREVQVQSEQRV